MSDSEPPCHHTYEYSTARVRAFPMDKCAVWVCIRCGKKLSFEEGMELFKPIEVGADDDGLPVDPRACGDCAGSGEGPSGAPCEHCGGDGKVTELQLLYILRDAVEEWARDEDLLDPNRPRQSTASGLERRMLLALDALREHG